MLLLQRAAVRPFTAKQIKLVETFADQAVIAIENTRLFEAEQQRTRELSESLEQQTATSEVLHAISASPGELEPVFAAMLAKATELCEASYGALWLREGDGYRTAALHGALPPAYVEQWRSGILHHPRPEVPLSRAVQTRKPVHIADLRADPAYLSGDMLPVSGADIAGIRTLTVIPMLKEGKAIGAIAIYRKEVRPFTDKQIELVANFAAQAVIAIENARLLTELRQRTTDLSESLEQQTATSEVLQVISSSPGDLQPVFASMLENAVRICDAKFGNIYRWDGDALHLMASHDTPAALAEARGRSPNRPGPETPTGRMIATKTFVHVADLTAEHAYAARDPWIVDGVELASVRTLLVVPMLKENELVGAVIIYRQEVRPFTEKQIALVQNFAAQAVIAIENARLLNELRQRTTDLTERTANLTEALEQQTATADVLKVISRSTFDLQTVLNTLLELAARLCEADKGQILRPTGKDASYYGAASYRHTPAYDEHMKPQTFAPGRGGVVGRVLLKGKSVQIPDVLADPEYTFREAARLGDFRTILGVPLLREAIPLGVLTLQRAAVRPFTEKQIKLVETFADQAVIAIENVRLFDDVQARTRELQETLEYQTAASDVLNVISRSPSNIEPVLDTIAETAQRLCHSEQAYIMRLEGGLYHLAAAKDARAERIKYLKDNPIIPNRGSVTGRVAVERRVVHITDAQADPEYTLNMAGDPGYRTISASHCCARETRLVS